MGIMNRVMKNNDYSIPAATVMKTDDYEKFKIIAGNRLIKPSNVRNLVESMKERLLMCPIIVNQYMEVIDGQHRLVALKELKLPVYYIMVKGYSIREVQMLNSYQKDWSVTDFMECYAGEGKESYIKYKDFYTKWKFNHQETMNLLSGTINQVGLNAKFRSGLFKVKSLSQAERNARKITMTGEYYAGFKRRCYVNALLICFSNDDFNHARLIQKLKYQSTKLVDCTNQQDYLSLIEDIYNFKSKVSDRIRLY
jgi:hypothetical protein